MDERECVRVEDHLSLEEDGFWVGQGFFWDAKSLEQWGIFLVDGVAKIVVSNIFSEDGITRIKFSH